MPTLRELRRATADRVAPFELVTTGVPQAGTPAGYAGTSLDASRRRIVSADLASMDALGLGPENPQDYLKNEWAYLLTDPPEQRRIPEGGFVGYARADEALTGYSLTLVDPAEPVGYVDVERPFRAVVPAGVEVEIHAIPPERGGKSAGLHAAINKALRVIMIEDTVLVPGESGKTTLDVTPSFPWLTNVSLFVGASYVQTVAGVETWAIPGARMRFDGDRLLLVPTTMVATGQSLPVRVTRPLSTWIKPQLASAWGESSVGLVDDEDTCLGNPDSISLVAAFHVAEEQAGRCIVGSAEAMWWQAKASAAAQRSPFLRDQRVRRPVEARQMWPDLVSVDGPLGGRYGPGFR